MIFEWKDCYQEINESIVIQLGPGQEGGVSQQEKTEDSNGGVYLKPDSKSRLVTTLTYPKALATR